MKQQGLFIVIDGMDGSGKGTQVQLLQECMQRDKRTGLFTREPGGVLLSENIRTIFASPEGADASALTQFFLMWAARSHWFEKLVIPSLKAGVLVISDRCDSSTFAYQLYAKQALELEEEFWLIRTLVFGSYAPSLYIIIDVPAGEAKRRVDADVSREKSSFDMKPLEWYERVRAGFQVFEKALPERVVLIDGTRPPEEIHKEIYRIIAGHCQW